MGILFPVPWLSTREDLYALPRRESGTRHGYVTITFQPSYIFVKDAPKSVINVDRVMGAL